MSLPSAASEVKLPDHEESIAPVTILDAQGRLVRVVAAKDFRRTPATGMALVGRIPPTLGPRRERGRPSVGGIRPTSAMPVAGVRRKSFAATTRTSRP